MHMHYNLISGSEREEPTCTCLGMSTQIILFPMPAYTYPHYCCLQHRVTYNRAGAKDGLTTRGSRERGERKVTTWSLLQQRPFVLLAQLAKSPSMLSTLCLTNGEVAGRKGTLPAARENG